MSRYILFFPGYEVYDTNCFEMESGLDGEEGLSPSESMRLIETQQMATVRGLGGDPLILYVPWGISWLGGFGALFLHEGLMGEPIVPISRGAALTVLATLMCAAGATSFLMSMRNRVKIKGAHAEKGMMYSYSWLVAFVGATTVDLRFSPLLSEQDAGLLWGATFFLIIATLYMAGAAIWQYRPMFWLGVCLAVVNTAGVIAGPGWHSLLVSVFGGGGFIIAGLFFGGRNR
jgi:hypothetical protein